MNYSLEKKAISGKQQIGLKIKICLKLTSRLQPACLSHVVTASSITL